MDGHIAQTADMRQMFARLRPSGKCVHCAGMRPLSAAQTGDQPLFVHDEVQSVFA